MAWYLRKSVKVGPIRFNLSKGGIGTSVGVKGFRVGVRPDGKSYLHAGRHGLYYRKTLDNGQEVVEDEFDLEEASNVSGSNVTQYNTASSDQLTSEDKQELIDALNKSYKSFRLDYLCGIIFLIFSIYLMNVDPLYSAIVFGIGLVCTIATAVWETKRRTVVIEYDFEDEQGKLFEQVVDSFNNLSINKKIWALVDSRQLVDAHESKLNAGAGNLVNRSDAKVGEGNPPWVKTNVSIPVLNARSQALYMMPDGILVYDKKGVGFVEYKDLEMEYSKTRFIEERPPRDAEIIDHTWKHPNKKGGPDKRFKENYQIPICNYGEIKMQSDLGLYFFLMTSNHETVDDFCRDFNKVLQMVGA